MKDYGIALMLVIATLFSVLTYVSYLWDQIWECVFMATAQPE